MSWTRIPARTRQWEGDSLPTSRAAPARLDRGYELVLPIRKVEPLRSESYRRFVASFHCFACSVPGYSQAAHPNFGKGLGLKTDDRLCFPLCTVRPGQIGCHEIHDQLIGMTLDQRRASEEEYIERMQRIARNARRKEFE